MVLKLIHVIAFTVSFVVRRVKSKEVAELRWVGKLAVDKNKICAQLTKT